MGHLIYTLLFRQDYVHTNSETLSQNNNKNRPTPKDKIPTPLELDILLCSASHLNFMHFNLTLKLLNFDGNGTLVYN